MKKCNIDLLRTIYIAKNRECVLIKRGIIVWNPCDKNMPFDEYILDHERIHLHEGCVIDDEYGRSLWVSLERSCAL